MTRRIVYSPEAQQHLSDIYLWIAEASGFADRAEGFVAAIIDYCEGMTNSP